MGKLNIAHHKSYHPYRRDNIERVRQDEEEAKLKEQKEEGRMMLADSEARIDLLRQRAGLVDKEKKKPSKHNENVVNPEEQERERELVQLPMSGELPTTNGHINLFHDVEQNMVTALTMAKKAESKASEQGVKLAPDDKELKRWYTERRSNNHRDNLQTEPNDNNNNNNNDDDGKSKREAQRKYKYDPLTQIEKQLAARSQQTASSSSSTTTRHHHHHGQGTTQKPRPPPSTSLSTDPSLQARLTRESSERERALALIQRRKKEMEGNMTPSTVCGGGDNDEGYRDVYNRQEVQDAHKGRERDRKRHWDRRRDW